MKLDDIVLSVTDLHLREVVPVQKSVSVRITGKVEDRLEVATTRAIMLGRFYEALTLSLFGGRLGDVYHVRPAEQDVIVRPDVVDVISKRLFESKAICSGQSGTLLDTQMQGYTGFSLQYPQYDIYFALYRHSLHGIKRDWVGTARELFSDLASHTAYLVVLPFDVVKRLHDPMRGSTKFMYRYESAGTEFDTCSCVRSSALTSLLVSPERVLEEMGLDLRGYEIERKMVRGCQIQNNVVRDFPMVYVAKKKDTTEVVPF